MADYTSIDRPYDVVANRIPGGTSPVISGDDLNGLFNSPAADAQFPDDIDGMQTTSTPGGAVETQQVNTGDSLANLWITSFIRSKNFKPGAVGFNIDGQTGSAEFNNVLVRGTIYATAGEIGGWTINATTIVGGGLTLNSTGSIGTTSFVSGQTGWNISDTGTAEFNNIIARGEFRTAVLTKDEVHATGGSLLVLGASVLLNNFTSVTTPTTSNLDLKDPPSGHSQLFAVNDIVRIKDGSGLDNWLKVTAVSDQTTYYRYTVDKQSGTNGTFYPGTGVVNYKQATDGFVLLTSDMANGPYMDIGLSSATPWTATTAKVRVGNLGGITDTTFGALSGYGIWTDSGYFTGSIVATAGRIGGTTNYWNITTGSIAAVGSGDVQIRAGQTDYDTGTGFWLGLKSGTAKLSMGVGAGKGITWDGTDFTFRTGATNAARLVIDSVDNKLTFYNASNDVVAQLGGGTFISSAFRATLNSDTTTGIKIDSSVASTIGVNISSSSNVSVRGINIDLTNTGTSNNGTGIDVEHDGSGGYAIDVLKATAGTGLRVINTGTGVAAEINSSANGASYGLWVKGNNASHAASLVYIDSLEAGWALDIASAGSGGINIWHTPASNTPSIFINHDYSYGAIELDVDGANGSETYGLLMDVRNSSTGVVAGISMTTGGSGSGAYYAMDIGGSGKFYESTAVGGTQDRKIRVRIGGTLYYVPCYTA